MSKSKKVLIFFFLSTCITCLIIFSSKNVNKGEVKWNQIQIVMDTLDINPDGYLRKVVLFRNKFYCMFETPQMFKKMIVYDFEGNFIENIFIPEEIQEMVQYELIVENDSLFIKESEFEKENFVLGDSVAEFGRIGKRGFKIYADEHYEVYSSCVGEWGGTVFFKDRQTKKVYEASSTCPVIVNKVKNEYYITNYLNHMIGFTGILKVSDPSKMQESKLNFDQQNGSEFELGIETILDTADFHITTSFVFDNSLFHLYYDKDETCIGKIKDQKLYKIKDFGFKFYSQLNQQLADGRQILSCHFEENEKNGILLIANNNFHFLRFR